MSDVRWMFHATAMGPDYDGIFGPLARLFGCRVLHRQQVPEPVGRGGGMTWIADNSIEIGSPFGDGSSVATFVERLGGGCTRWRCRSPDVAGLARPARTARRGGRVADRHELVFTRPGGTAGAGARVGEATCRTTTRASARRCRRSSRAGGERRAHGVRRRDRPRSRADGERLAEVLDTELVDVRATTRRSTSARPRWTWATACSRCTRYHPTRRRAARSWGGVYERPRLPGARTCRSPTRASPSARSSRWRGGAPPRRRRARGARRRDCRSRSCSPTGCSRVTRDGRARHRRKR